MRWFFEDERARALQEQGGRRGPVHRVTPVAPPENGRLLDAAATTRRSSSSVDHGTGGGGVILQPALARPGTPTVPDRVDAHLVSLLSPSSRAAQQYRALRHAVEELRKSAAVSVLAVSSPSVNDGKTTTAINLAGALAQAPDARILLVEADLRRPSLVERLALGWPCGPGLTGLVANPRLTLEGAVTRLLRFNLDVLPAGPVPPTPYDVLESPRLGELLEQARGGYDFVVLDTPPLIPVLDCRLLEKWVDGFLLVVAAHKTPRQLVAEALTVMGSSKILGLVFNGDDRAAAGSAAYGRSDDGPVAPWWRRPLRGRRAGAPGPDRRRVGRTERGAPEPGLTGKSQ